MKYFLLFRLGCVTFASAWVVNVWHSFPLSSNLCAVWVLLLLVVVGLKRDVLRAKTRIRLLWLIGHVPAQAVRVRTSISLAADRLVLDFESKSCKAQILRCKSIPHALVQSKEGMDGQIFLDPEKSKVGLLSVAGSVFFVSLKQGSNRD